MFHLFITVFIILISSIAYASSCSEIKDTPALYSCAIEKYPDYQVSQMTKASAKASRAKVTQFPNPELSLETSSGKVAGENVGSTEISVSFDITKLAITRPAIYKAGKATEKLVKIEAAEQELKARSSLLRDIYRYRQVLDELEFVEEALSAFSKIEGQFKRRRARGPEQQISLNLVELVQGDYELKKNHLVVKKTEIEAKFLGIFGDDFKIEKSWLPSIKTSWPSVQNALVPTETLELRKLQAKRDMLEAEKSVAMAESWPIISAGPSMTRETEGTVQYHSYGFNVTVTVPILSWNGGARNLAKQESLKVETELAYASRKAELEKKLLLQKYESAVQALKSSISSKDLHQRHKKIDRLFSQGLTSGSTIIEAHRQILEFTQSQHEHELMALDTLMHINFLSNNEISKGIL